MSDAEYDSEEAYKFEEMTIEAQNQPQQGNGRTDQGPELDLDLRIERPQPARTTQPGPPPQLREGHMGKSANTGPKGVKADFEEAKFNQRNVRMRERLERERKLDRMAQGAKVLHVESKQEKAKDEDALKAKAKARKETDEEDEDEDEEDDKAFKEYKARQLQALEDALPSFGVHRRVSYGELVTLVKKFEGQGVHMVVHLYQNHVEQCVRLNLVLEELARQFPRICFLRIRSTEAVKGFKPVGLPALMIYKGGKCTHTLLRAHDEIGKLSDLSVAQFLQRIGVLSAGSAVKEGAVTGGERALPLQYSDSEPDSE